MNRHWRALLTAVLVLGAPMQGLAEKEEEHTVLLAAPGSQSELCGRLRTELTLAGWLVVETPESGTGPLRPPSEVARHVQASVAMRVDAKGDVELWIVDPDTHSTVHHELIDTDPSQGVDVMTLRVLEVLRARLIKLGVSIPTAPSRDGPATPGGAAESPSALPDSTTAGASSPSPSKEPPAPAPTSGPPEADGHVITPATTGSEEAKRGFDVFAAPLVAWSPGGVGWSSEIAFGAHYVHGGTLALGVSAALPMVSASTTTEQGTVSVHWGWLGAVVERRFPLDGGAVCLGALAGVVEQRLSGEARAPYRNATDWITAGIFLANLGAELKLSDPLRLRIDGSIGFAAPRPVVLVADQSAASWGRPLVLASVGVEWDVWRTRPRQVTR